MGDLPDYTKQVVIRYEGGFMGLEELATRLGFIGPWDLKGNIVLMEDFESEETEWEDGSCQAGGTAARSSRHKYSGDWSVKLYTPVGVATQAVIERMLSFSEASKYALFCRLCWNEECQKISCTLTWRDGTTFYQAQVRYDFPNSTLSVVTSGGAEYNVATVSFTNFVGYTWFPCLVIFDVNTGYYNKLYFAGVEYDIASVPLYSTSPTVPPGLMVRILSVQPNASIFTFYVDDIIIAKNVP